MSYCQHYSVYNRPIGSLFSPILNGPLTVIIIFFGCSGNLFTVCFAKRLTKGKSFFYYLITLAFWDTGVLLGAFGYYGLENSMFSINSKSFFNYWYYFYGIFSTSLTGSVWAVTSITVARYMAISNPIKHKIEHTKAKVQLICMMLSLAAVAFNLPNQFQFIPEICLDMTTNQSSFEIEPTELRLNSYYKFVRQFFFYFPLELIMPFLTILILSFRMIRSLRRRNEHIYNTPLLSRNGYWNQSARDGQSSLILLILLLKFIICYTLHTGINLGEPIFEENSATTRSPIFQSFVAVSNLLVITNSATNFVIFFWWRQKNGSKSRSLSLSDTGPSLTKQQLLILAQSWKKAYDLKGSEIGITLLAEFINEKPNLGVHFGISQTDVVEDLEKITKIQNQGIVITRFIDMQIGEAVLCPQQGNLRHLAALHFDLGINFTADLWRQFKKVIIREVLDMDENEFREITSSDEQGEREILARIWNRFLSFMVSEMKKGFIEEAQNSCNDTAL